MLNIFKASRAGLAYMWITHQDGNFSNLHLSSLCGDVFKLLLMPWSEYLVIAPKSSK